MFVSINPSAAKIQEYIEASPHKAAKWIKDNETGDYYYWPASDTPHAKMAKMLRVTNYDKGLAVND